MKALDLISMAMSDIGARASGEAPSAAEANDALLYLNQMIDAWTAERLMIFTLNISKFPLVAGKQTYTLGTGGDFNIARPSRIGQFSIENLANPALPLELPIGDSLTDVEWQVIPVKTIQSALPTDVYDDGAFPLRNLSFYPVPSGAIALNAVIYGWAALSQFADLSTTDYTFPPGYAEAIHYNLAPRLAPQFGKATPSEIAIFAQQALARIKSANITVNKLKCDDSLVNPQGGRFNWLTGEAV